MPCGFCDMSGAEYRVKIGKVTGLLCSIHYAMISRFKWVRLLHTIDYGYWGD